MWRLIRPWINGGSHESDPNWCHRENSLATGRHIRLGDFELRLVSVEKGAFELGSITGSRQHSPPCIVATIEVTNHSQSKSLTPFILVQGAVDSLGNSLEEGIMPFEWIKGDKRMKKLEPGQTLSVKVSVIPKRDDARGYEIDAMFDPGGESTLFALAFDLNEVVPKRDEPVDW